MLDFTGVRFDAIVRPDRVTSEKAETFVTQSPGNKGTVNSLIATTSRERPPPVSDHFVNNRFVSQLNTVSRAVS